MHSTRSISMLIIVVFGYVDCSVANSHSEDYLLTLTNFSLRPCVHYRNSRNSQTIVVPRVEVVFNGNQLIHTYKTHTHRIEYENPMVECPDGSFPVLETNLLEKYDYDRIPVHNSFELIKLHRRSTLLLPNGMLSVGASETSTTYYNNQEFCVQDHTLGTAIFLTCKHNVTRPVLRKCLPLGFTELAIPGMNLTIVPSEFETFDPGYLDGNMFNTVPLNSVNPVILNERLIPLCKDGKRGLGNQFVQNCATEFHPTNKENRVALINQNRKWELLSKREWCLDSRVAKRADGGGVSKSLVMNYCKPEEKAMLQPAGSSSETSKAYMYSMYVGAFFHLMTTAVYVVTWRRQNIHGRTLCSCTLALFVMQVCLGTAHLYGLLAKRPERGESRCVANAVAAHYFMLAAFTWLLVVNIDLWRTFRMVRPDAGAQNKNFIVYSCVGWGLPLLITSISLILDNVFRCRKWRVLVPEYGVHYCFVAPWAQGPYVYYILGALTFLSWTFSILTLYGLYKFKRSASGLRSNKGHSDQQTILLFMKLTVVMGLSWIFEVISWTQSTETGGGLHWTWVVFDIYNVLSAVLIFAIFVCKRTTLALLEETIPQIKRVTGALNNLGSAGPASSTATTSGGGNQAEMRVVEGRNKRDQRSASPLLHTGNNEQAQTSGDSK